MDLQNMMNIAALNIIDAKFIAYRFPLTFTAVTEVLPNPLKVRPETDGAFELLGITTDLPGDFFIKIKDGSINHYLNNDWIPSNCICGDGEYPYLLPYSYLFKPGKQIYLEAKNGSLAANTGEVVFYGFTHLGKRALMEYPIPIMSELAGSDIFRRFYTYVIDANFPVTGLEVNQKSVDIANTTIFNAKQLMSSHARTKSYSIQAGDNFSTQRFFYEAMNGRNVTGTSKRPFYLFPARTFSGNASIVVDTTGRDATPAAGQIVIAGGEEYDPRNPTG